jgi:hypothetical protein
LKKSTSCAFFLDAVVVVELRRGTAPRRDLLLLRGVSAFQLLLR